MPNNHLMLDLETAGTGPTAAILTIGILLFDPHGDGSEDQGYHWIVPFEMNKNRNVDLNTVKWWMQQSPGAREASWLDPRGNVAMGNVFEMLERVDHIWANDPDFDCTILRDFIEQHGSRWKWFRKHRSMRTIKALFGTPEIDNIGTAHNALDDCKFQAAQVRNIVQVYGVKFEDR